MISENQISQMASIFSGLTRAYGVYDLSEAGSKDTAGGQKVTGKPKTVQAPVTLDLWRAHLDGTNGLGIIPINDQSKCNFGAIDIDLYKGFDIKPIIDKIYQYDIPLIPFRSKSGGLHLFIFLSEPVPAKLLVEKLRAIATYFGHASAEVFPKQTEILVERGDIGQWINIGYFDAEKTNRYAYNADLTPMTLDQFLAQVKKVRLSLKDLEKYSLIMDSAFEDGPPCLQQMATTGFPSGSRNDSMFAVGIYLKQAFPATFEEKFLEANMLYCNPKLASSEISTLYKQLQKKTYFYTCERSPCKDYCDKETCLNRKFGVGSSTSMPILTGLTKFDSNPPIWFVEVEGHGRVELTTDELQNQQKFQKKCMDTINQMPPTTKQDKWQKMLSVLMESVTVIEVPKDSAPQGLFLEFLDKFCNRSPARSMDEIKLNKVYTENGRCYFRLSDLWQYLERQRFQELPSNKMLAILKEVGGVHETLTLKGTSVNVWHIPVAPQSDSVIDTPVIEEKNVI